MTISSRWQRPDEVFTAAEKMQAMPDCARLFVGTFLGDREIAAVNSLEKANPNLSEGWNIRARFVPNEKLHLTWLFLGNVERIKIPVVETCLKTAIADWQEFAGVSLLNIQYEQLQVWPSLLSPRVLVLEATKNLKHIRALNKSINTNLQAFCQSKDEVERFDVFRPHITVCRFSANKGPLIDTQRHIEDFNLPEKMLPVTQSITSLTLIESDLSSQSIEQHNLKKGAYRVIKQYQLNLDGPESLDSL
ncbi:MAG: hypothetical protein IAF58_20075 [Leptolyngbya sp.]|nr:hypothetical protein [Candidatus Melainabacteria bacterium]